MTPEQFLALYEPKPEAAPEKAAEPADTLLPPPSRVYQAYAEGNAETFLTMHTAREGVALSLPYNQIHLVSCDERGGTLIKLHGPVMNAELRGRNLWPLMTRLRLRACAHVYEFNGGSHDPPAPGRPVVMQIAAQPTRPAPQQRPAQPQPAPGTPKPQG